MESPAPLSLDLDEVEAEIRKRWFVWTAAGLTVHPVSRADRDDATSAAPTAGGAGVTAPPSLGLRISRPTAHVDLLLRRDGSTEMAVLRPEADAVVRTTVQVKSMAAFAQLLDRVVELITWSGVAKDRGQRPIAPAAGWVVGYDGEGWSNQA